MTGADRWDGTALRAALGDYLRLRRALGYGLARAEKLLAQFICFLEEHQATSVTVADALVWVRLPADASPTWLRMRMSAVRGFTTYLHGLDPSIGVPPKGLVPGRTRRAVPYLYSDADIAALLRQACMLRTPLRVATIQTLICVLAVTGMRIGEVINLDDADVDAETGLLRVRAAKGGRQRLVPVHPTTITALTSYQTHRDQVFPQRPDHALLVASTGTRLRYNNVSVTFATLVRRAGLTARSASCRPRPHDLRHTFAVQTLLDWYRDGADIPARLPLLSTYLGHVEPANTYWYLQAAPELLAEAANRLQTSAAHITSNAGPSGAQQ
jgi:integrase